jgi:cytochrome c biogenesis protein CcmG, thiol:disulfide interchange protein DsbE
MWKLLLPLGLFFALGVLLFAGLGKDPKIVPSVLINKPAPAFELPVLNDPNQRISKTALLGKPYLLNVWASWCFACRVEHPVVTDLAKSGLIAVYGLNYKDEPADANRWLEQFGNPYKVIAQDLDGRTAIDFGVYGAPETFLIDAKGVIRHKVIGPITPEIIAREIKPRLAAMETTKS